ncbi:hypothetical protein AVDCRST_MAG84-3577 [uncultured Microcoleus sp.]|uniref:Uncharacterized protein n=1 Tax=uncultured Microcoleus sp. TaxID=259945 RepID=A0A6J4ML24_9CYAN|nr:hypothetical protein AVDCRST_MAG84-3577 [uncultured Microcoleus sp.]
MLSLTFCTSTADPFRFVANLSFSLLSKVKLEALYQADL